MFATKADMLARFGERELIQLTDREGTGVIDDAVLQQGLDDADAEVSGYIAGRYPLPFPSVPRPLVGYACDIARYRLTGTEVTCTEDIQQRYDYAIKFLRMVNKGEVQLGVDANGQPAGGAAPATAVKTKVGQRRFNADSMEGY